jgi:hypothetical protein
MKRPLLLFAAAFILIPLSSVFSQTFTDWHDYIKAVKGDTLVIKDYNDMGGVANSLTNVLNLDTANVPAGRVYELEATGYYPLTANPTTAARGVVIVGADNTRLVNNTNANSAPPLLCGSTIQGGGANTGGLNWGGNLTVKNCNMIPAASDGTLGWLFFWGVAPNCRVTLENDLFERTRWIEVASNNQPGTSLFIKDCYFVNLKGNYNRWNGGVYDNVNNNTDTIWVENSTHILCDGSMYKFRNFQIGKLFFNHNTFINCIGSVFESLGYESNLTVTNNIFVNCDLQPTCDSVLTWDAGEVDPDNLPTGLVNCAPLPSTFQQMPRKILVDRNVVYWDPRFNNMDSILIANRVNGTVNWVLQMITMNTRTQAMFDDNKDYPYLTEGTWYKKCPTFVQPKDLLRTQVDSVKAFAVSFVNDRNTSMIPDWRLVNTGSSNFVHSDWPIPVNLAYTDADLMTGGTNGSPVGDLNWLPTQKAAWLAGGMKVEHDMLDNQLNSGTLSAVRNDGTEPASFTLSQNYPNPFNPTTVISYQLPAFSHVALKVHDVLGREVATLVDETEKAGSYQAVWNASRYASGVYFYRLSAGSLSGQAGTYHDTKKLLLLK